MANKGMKNMFGGLKDIFSKPTPADEKEQAKDEIGASRDRERKMLNALGEIKLHDPQRQLSDAKLRELNVQGVIDYATHEIKSYPFVSEFDLTNLDNNITYIIGALDTAVRDGLESAAEWACTALVCALNSLRTKVDGIDEEFANELMECRVEYSENLKLLVQSSIERDRTKKELDDQLARRKTARKDMDTRKSSYQTRRDAGLLNALLAEMQQKANRPGDLSDDAVALRDELYAMHRLKASLIEMDATINAKQVALNGHETEIQSRRNTLSSPPRITDPKLQDKIEVANSRFRARLRRQLNDAEDAIKAYGVHISAMSDLANHSVHIMTIAQALEMDKEIQLEQLKQRQLEKDAAALQAQAAVNANLIRETIKIPEPVVEVVQEQEQEVEYVNDLA